LQSRHSTHNNIDFTSCNPSSLQKHHSACDEACLPAPTIATNASVKDFCVNIAGSNVGLVAPCDKQCCSLQKLQQQQLCPQKWNMEIALIIATTLERHPSARTLSTVISKADNIVPLNNKTFFIVVEH
jgi:hypothetical protein